MKKLYAINNILFLIFMIIAIPTIFMSEIGSNLRWGSSNHQQETILSNAEATKLLSDKKRKSLISYQKMILIDSIEMTFVIPVSQNELKKAQEISFVTDFYEKVPENKVNAILKEIPDNLVSVPKNLVYGIYNNIILYNQKTNVENTVFQSRVSISSIQVMVIDGKKHLAVRYSDFDSNVDGKMDINDKQNISIFRMDGKCVIKIDTNPFDVKEVLFSEGNKIYVTVIDTEASKLTVGEVMRIFEVNLETSERKLLFKKRTDEYIQEILDGKNQKDGAQESNRDG